MTRQARELDALLSAYFRDGPTEAPDRVLDATIEQLSRTRQDRRRWQPWRFEMSDRMRLGLAAAAAVVVLVAGVAILGRPQTPPVASSPSPASSTGGSPLPSTSAVTAGPSPTGPTITPSIGLGKRAITRLTSAIGAAQRDGLLTADQAGRLQAAADGAGLSLDDGSLSLALVGLQSVKDQAGAALDASPGGPSADALRDAVTALDNALTAGAIPTGAIPPGSYVSSGFARPYVALALGEGWARYLDDSEVLAFRRGKTTLAFHHTATAVTPAAMVSAVGQGGSGDFSLAPSPVTIGAYPGLVGQTPAGATLWFDAALNAYDPAPGDVVRIWILTVEQRALTIELLGPPADVAAELPDVERILATFVAYEPSS